LCHPTGGNYDDHLIAFIRLHDDFPSIAIVGCFQDPSAFGTAATDGSSRFDQQSQVNLGEPTINHPLLDVRTQLQLEIPSVRMSLVRMSFDRHFRDPDR
jgi:hypothetical protein